MSTKRDKQLHKGLILNNFPAYFLFGTIAFLAFFVFQVIQPFFMVLLFAGIVSAVTYDLYEKMIVKLKGSESWAAVVTTLIVIFAFIIPLTFFLTLLVSQGIQIFHYIEGYLKTVDFNSLLSWQPGNFFYDHLGDYREPVWNYISENKDSLISSMTDFARSASGFLAGQSTKILSSIALTIFNFLLLSFTLYFFYRDGKKIARKLMMISPIPIHHEKEIFKKFNEISRATLYGTFLTAVAQGFVAWVGFLIAGLPSAFFWSTAVSVFSLVPVVGTSMVWLPAGLIMLASGNIFGGIFILCWGAGLVSTVDNFLRVIFIGSSAKLNPLVTFVAVFGGILAFDLIGVILGPMLVVLFFTLLDIYEKEYADILETSELPRLESKEEQE